jgi:hypothetical protein
MAQVFGVKSRTFETEARLKECLDWAKREGVEVEVFAINSVDSPNEVGDFTELIVKTEYKIEQKTRELWVKLGGRWPTTDRQAFRTIDGAKKYMLEQEESCTKLGIGCKHTFEVVKFLKEV